MIEQTVKSLWIHVEGCQYCQHWSIYKSRSCKVKFSWNTQQSAAILPIRSVPKSPTGWSLPNYSPLVVPGPPRLQCQLLWGQFPPAFMWSPSIQINPNPGHLFSPILLGEKFMEGRSFPSSLDFPASAIEAWQSGPVPLRKAKTTCPKRSVASVANHAMEQAVATRCYTSCYSTSFDGLKVLVTKMVWPSRPGNWSGNPSNWNVGYRELGITRRYNQQYWWKLGH